jgi:hypothetical protein
MKNFSFENLHPNHKFAFLDGFLCGLLVAKVGYDIYQDVQEDRKWKKLAEEHKNEDHTDPLDK